MTLIDVTALAGILRDAAKAEILPRFRRLEPGTVKVKSNPTDLVTEADTEAEWAIKREVERRWPGTLVVGEESVAADPALLGRLAAAEVAITVDPVDGTANFAAGLPLFAVMAAIVVRGETVGGIIYDPMGDDWMLAERGAGAWHRRPDGAEERLRVREPASLADMIAHVSIAFLPPERKPEILANLAKLRISANYRVAGHDYRTFASGHAHCVMFNKLMPWDHLPGALISEEAGGHVRKFDGSPYRPADLRGGLLLATDAESWSLLRREVFTL
ncbi:MAG: inositol monophosphatase [Devosia sp.]|uniref:inositol monophosphatase family protein n=1 Tax=Devosia sp. 66-22 TaxID=1895753 RepID=UPI00092B7A78|nr:inositol monophosphatase [Devosia sp. 66-22]MBN9348778.1 inositol monophosphatase [Devosia sp.]OJX50410.1 MAG: inositol monophosphatase [Devosia sp. 66-22]